MSDETVRVDPDELVCAHLRSEFGPAFVRAVSYRYVQVRGPAIQLELVYDPANQSPAAAYDAPVARLQTFQVRPAALIRVHVYEIGKPCRDRGLLPKEPRP